MTWVPVHRIEQMLDLLHLLSDVDALIFFYISYIFLYFFALTESTNQNFAKCEMPRSRPTHALLLVLSIGKSWLGEELLEIREPSLTSKVVNPNRYPPCYPLLSWILIRAFPSMNPLMNPHPSLSLNPLIEESYPLKVMSWHSLRLCFRLSLAFCQFPGKSMSCGPCTLSPSSLERKSQMSQETQIDTSRRLD